MKKSLIVICFCLLFSTISLCQIEDNDSVPKKVTIEGVLKMYLINWFGGSVEINDYYETFYEGEYIAFVVETDEEINVIPYLDRENKNNLLSIVDESEISEIKYSNFMIVPNFYYDEENFVKLFVNKRVRATGSFYVPIAGWRYYTMVIMNLDSIEQL